MSLRLITLIRILLKVKVSETKSEFCTLEGQMTDTTQILNNLIKIVDQSSPDGAFSWLQNMLRNY